jgi:hypothetical protein
MGFSVENKLMGRTLRETPQSALTMAIQPSSASGTRVIPSSFEASTTVLYSFANLRNILRELCAGTTLTVDRCRHISRLPNAADGVPHGSKGPRHQRIVARHLSLVMS